MIDEENYTSDDELNLTPMPITPPKAQSELTKITPESQTATPSRPKSTIAKNLEPEFRKTLKDSTPKEQDTPFDQEIVYQGRNILDLKSNTEFKWSFRPSSQPETENFYSYSESNDHITILRRRFENGRYFYYYPQEPV